MDRVATWQCLPSQSDFPEYVDAWDQLNCRFLREHPMGDSSFVEPLLTHFATDRDFLAVSVADSKPRSMILLRSGRFGIVSSFRPAQTEISPVLIGSMDELESLFEALPWSTLAVQLHCQDPDYCFFSYQSSRLMIDIEQHATTVCIDLDGSFESYWSERPVKLRQNIERTFRKLKAGALDWRFAVVESAEDVAQAVERYGDLEIKGWKFRAGTAVHSSNAQGEFYSDTLRRFAEKGRAIVYELYFDNKLVSSQLCIANKSMMITLKTTYDEDFGKYSPGKLLDYLMLQHEFELARFAKVEFCTNAGAELTRWGTRTRQVSHITVYRNKLSWRLLRIYRNLKMLVTGSPDAN